MSSLPSALVVIASLAVLSFSARAAAPGKAEATASAERNRAPVAEALLQPRAPVIGQPFDDREVELYLELEARKLFAAGRLLPLKFERRTFPLQLAAPATEILRGPEIAARAEAATLIMGEFARESKKREITFCAAGGGFVVAASGICVTSLHVTKEKAARGFCAMTRDGQVLPVREVLAFDPVNDLALLQLELPPGVTLPTLALAREPAPVGSPVFVMSHPDDRFYLLSTGFVARHTLWRTEAGDETFMTITADFAKGSSGCPVLDEHGAVIGIVNNTESIYYDDDGRKKQTDLQMVVKNATPSWTVRGMLEEPTPKAAVAAP